MINLRAKQNAPLFHHSNGWGKGGLNFSFDLSEILAFVSVVDFLVVLLVYSSLDGCYTRMLGKALLVCWRDHM